MATPRMPAPRSTSRGVSWPADAGRSMFATLLGGLPTPDPGDVAPVEVAVRAQEEAGLEPITDGRLGPAGADPVDAWRFTSGLTAHAVKQALSGPYSVGWSDARGAPADVRRRRTVDAAKALRGQVEALADAGCPLIEIEEAEAHRIGLDEAERRLFREAHRILTEGLDGTHLSLSIVGGAADRAGFDTILEAPYASLALDLIGGPDNWNLATRAAGDRGIVAGALGAREHGDEPREVLLWAAHYAASTGGRGLARVGLGSAGSYANLTWAAAVRKMRLLGSAARLAELPPGEELTAQLEPQAVSARRAGLGRNATPPPGSIRRQGQD
jgi:Cobalamin-independent synthase, Catalytic domain